VGFNPLRHEADAFRVLLYLAAIMGAVIIVIVVVRALA
jgi:hypothetical protein